MGCRDRKSPGAGLLFASQTSASAHIAGYTRLIWDTDLSYPGSTMPKIRSRVGNETLVFFPSSRQLSMVGLQPSSLMSTSCVVPLRGDWAVFCHAGSGRVGRVWSVREKSLEILRHGWELKLGHGEDRQWDSFIFPTELSWLILFNRDILCKNSLIK